jgi:sec-independent protein translocase protein TatA
MDFAGDFQDEPRVPQNALQVRQLGRIVPPTMSILASLLNLGGPDLIWILLLILLLFGAKKLPELARGMGQAIKEFQKAKDEFTDELHKAGPTDAKNRPPASTVARSDAPPAGAVRPDPNQAANPGDQSKPV